MKKRIEMVSTKSQKLSIRKKCDLLNVPRSNLYYQPVPEKPENVKMMNIMDRHLLKHPKEGVESMVNFLKEKRMSSRSKENKESV
ncbi:MAG: hypothetical protein IPO72_05625 [Saprospiraceae bacterium]|nr:hypothetical protein [Candidatus Vicinibacter affinis]